MAPVGRLWVRTVIPDRAGLDDVDQVAAELIADTMRFGQWTGFVITVSTVRGRVRIAVTDQGNPEPDAASGTSDEAADSHPDDLRAAHARGLQLVNALAHHWGHDTQTDRRQTLWAEWCW